MKTGPEGEVQEKSGWDQSPPSAGAAGKDMLCHTSSEFCDGEGVAARREGVFLRNLGSTSSS